MKSFTALGGLLVLSASILACATEVAGSGGDGATAAAALNPACALLSTCCERWPADLRSSCTGPVKGNGDACKTLLSNNGAVSGYCPELSVENCSEELKKVLPDQCAGSSDGSGSGLGSFSASNLGKITVPPGLVDVAMPAESEPGESKTCVMETSTGASDCLLGTNKFVAKRMGDYDVLFAKSFSIPENTLLTLVGPRPVIIVATETIDVQGILNAGAFGGAYSKDGASPGAQTTGPGVGANNDGSGDGGGSYCGIGSIGFPETKGIAGKPYGEATLVPLVGGSRGGELEAGGAGGGALQLVAGNTIAIGKHGAVGARGQDGSRGGGGSGGALLLEAPTIEGNGRIDAQGGNGGASYFESPGVGPGGGKGGREANANGTNATEAYGGGGGGAGRIRLNARAMDFKGTISPNEQTKCVSRGTLADP